MEESKLLDALTYAIGVIESYQLDINDMITKGILREGFCQGSLYINAVSDIKRRGGIE